MHQTLLMLIRQSCDNGARLQKTNALIVLDARAVRGGWHICSQQGDPAVTDKRCITIPLPNKLSGDLSVNLQ